LATYIYIINILALFILNAAQSFLHLAGGDSGKCTSTLYQSVETPQNPRFQAAWRPSRRHQFDLWTTAKGLSQTFKGAKIRRQQQFYFIDGPWIPLRLLATEYLLGTSRSECFENCTSRAHLEDLTNLCWSAPFRCWAQHAQQSQGNNLLISVASGFLYRWQGAPWGMLQLPPSLKTTFSAGALLKTYHSPGHILRGSGHPAERPPSMLARLARNINKPDLNIYMYIYIIIYIYIAWNFMKLH